MYGSMAYMNSLLAETKNPHNLFTLWNVIYNYNVWETHFDDQISNAVPHFVRKIYLMFG